MTTLTQISRTMTTAQIVKHFRERGGIDMLLFQLHMLPKGEQLAIETCLNPVIKDAPIVMTDDCDMTDYDFDGSYKLEE